MAVVSEAHRPRKEPRVAYSAQVRLSGDWSDREPCFVPLLAQTLDLSENGMALVTPLPLPTGAIVTCSMRVGGCQLYIVGSVRWEHMESDGMRRAGIEFLPPSHEDTGVMRRLLELGKLHPHRIQMRFDGRPDTLTALAQVTRSGLALTAPLPILRRNTGVRFSFTGEGADRASFHGRVDRVRLAQHEGMPALEVGIRVPNALAVHDAAHNAQRKQREDSTPTGVEVSAPPREPDDIGLAARAALFARKLTDRAAAFRLPTTAAIMLALGALSLGALAHELSRPQAPELVVSPSPAPVVAPVHAAEPAMDPGPDPIMMFPRSAAPAPTTRELTFKWRKNRREIFIPIEGDLSRVHHFRVGEPAGVAIELPRATAPAALERYSVRRPGVQRVDIDPEAGGARIRVWTSRPFADYRVEATRGGIRFTIPGPFKD
jgi:hypothetical protein